MTEHQRAIEAILRQDLESFVRKTFTTVSPGERYLPNWHIDCLAWHLQRCARREIKRLIITVPPRYLKSICASVAFPAWLLGRDPTEKIICVSYAQDLARKHATDTRRVMASDWYRRLFPSTRIRSNTESEITTTRAGARLTTSIGGTLTGRGGNVLIVDDPIKADAAMSEVERQRVKDFYDQTLYSRLDNKNDGVIILVMQRLHEDDLVGHVIDSDDWTVLDMPAIAVEERTYTVGAGGRTFTRPAGEPLHAERESLERLADLRRRIGTPAFASQYQQQPQPPEGNLIRREWLKFYEEPLPRYDMIVQSWDTASSISPTADYSVGMTFGIKNLKADLLDVVRVRLEYPDLRRRVIAEYRRRGAHVLVLEDASSGLALGPDLRCEHEILPLRLRPDGDKIARLETHSAKIENGTVRFPADAPWLANLLAELLAFPSSRHDDQVDALTLFLEWLSMHRRRRMPMARPNPVRPSTLFRR